MGGDENSILVKPPFVGADDSFDFEHGSEDLGITLVSCGSDGASCEQVVADVAEHLELGCSVQHCAVFSGGVLDDLEDFGFGDGHSWFGLVRVSWREARRAFSLGRTGDPASALPWWLLRRWLASLQCESGG